jgi:hypothetical protein
MKGNGNMTRSDPSRWYNLQIQTEKRDAYRIEWEIHKERDH